MIRGALCQALVLSACALLWSAPVIAIEMSDAYVLPMPQTPTFALDAQSAGVGDTNGDGRADVVVFAEDTIGKDPAVDQVVFIYEQQSDGTMALVKTVSLAPDGTYLYWGRGGAVADLDGDGIAELLVAGEGPNRGKLMILRRNAAGDYVAVAGLPCPFNTVQIYTKDLDADGRADILVQDGGRGYAVFWGQGSFAFSKPMYVLGFQAGTAVFADVDHDGVDDLVSADHIREPGFGVNFGLSKTGAPPGGIYDYTEPTFFDWTPGLPSSAAYGRFPGASQNSLALWYEEKEYPNADHPNYILFYQNIRTLLFTDQQHYSITGTYRYQSGISRNLPPIRSVDIDKDGDDDIIVFTGKHIEILLQQDSGFAPVYVVPDTSDAGGNHPTTLTASVVADFNGDGCDDLGYMNRSFVIHYRVDCPLP